MPPPQQAIWSQDKIRRHNALADLYNTWPGDEDPDDDPEFVRRSREIMGEPPLEQP